MGREEEMGILIELVSVRAGASSKGWRTTESLHVGGCICARAGWKPPEPRSIHLDCCVAKAPFAFWETTRSLLLLLTWGVFHPCCSPC